jgi:hypothetical protein
MEPVLREAEISVECPEVLFRYENISYEAVHMHCAYTGVNPGGLGVVTPDFEVG